MTVRRQEECLEWWAGFEEAGLLTTSSLVVSQKRTDGRWSVKRVNLDPKSWQHYNRELTSIPDGKIAPGEAAQKGPPVAAPPGTPELPFDFTSFLGNLPLDAQRFLQVPFTFSRSKIEAGYFYYRSQVENRAELVIWCYMATKKHVTVANGKRLIPFSQYDDPFAIGPWPWDMTLHYASGLNG